MYKIQIFLSVNLIRYTKENNIGAVENSYITQKKAKINSKSKEKKKKHLRWFISSRNKILVDFFVTTYFSTRDKIYVIKVDKFNFV